MSHLFYVTASYAAAFGITLILIVSVFLDGRARARELRELEARGIRRRSAQSQPLQKDEA